MRTELPRTIGRGLAAGVAAAMLAVAALPAAASAEVITPHAVTPQVVIPQVVSPAPVSSPAPAPEPSSTPAPSSAPVPAQTPAPTPTADSGPAGLPQPQGDGGSAGPIPKGFPGYPWDLPNPWSPACGDQCSDGWSTYLADVERAIYRESVGPWGPEMGQDIYEAQAGDIAVVHEVLAARLENADAAENLVNIAIDALPIDPADDLGSGSSGSGGGMAGWLEHLKSMFEAE